MKTGPKLVLFAAGLLVAFAAAFGIARVAVPDSVVAAWTDRADAAHDEHGGEAPASSDVLPGLSLSADGYVLGPVAAPGAVGVAGALSFGIHDPDGAPLTAYTTAHEKDLHLIVVRADGTQFRHVHPQLDTRTGTWSLPWTWEQAGTYRVYADFVPEGGTPVTLTRTVEAGGDFAPVTPPPARVAQVDGYTVTLTGDVRAGSSSVVSVVVERDGAPVTTLQPYLGAFGHLVALREGDLAYLHVHPEGDEPLPEATGGPRIGFALTAPTAGRYLLYLDFQIDGVVRTASFVVDAIPHAGH